MAERAVRSIRIQVAAGGWTVEVEREPEKKKNGDCMPCCWEPTTPSVYIEKDTMLSAIGDLLGGGSGKKPRARVGRVPLNNEA
jgi:hypothetical protein